MLIVLLACANPAPSPAAPAPAVVVAPPPPPPPVCEAVQSPFLGEDRRSLVALKRRWGSGFGDYRSSYIKGHRHAGLDLTTSYGEAVFAICAGVVEDIHLASPHRTVVVRHELPDGQIRWSSYKHLEDLGVVEGQRVDASTRLGRVFTKEEQASSGWRLNHLHFELRVSVDDGGAASWTSMSMGELQRYASDPAPFFAERMVGG